MVTSEQFKDRIERDGRRGVRIIETDCECFGECLLDPKEFFERGSLAPMKFREWDIRAREDYTKGIYNYSIFRFELNGLSKLSVEIERPDLELVVREHPIPEISYLEPDEHRSLFRDKYKWMTILNSSGYLPGVWMGVLKREVKTLEEAVKSYRKGVGESKSYLHWREDEYLEQLGEQFLTSMGEVLSEPEIKKRGYRGKYNYLRYDHISYNSFDEDRNSFREENRWMSV